MSRLQKMIAAVIAAIGAVALLLSNLNTIYDTFKRATSSNSNNSLEVSEVMNYDVVTWSSGGGTPTGEISYVANFLIRKRGDGQIDQCKILAIYGDSLFFTPEENYRPPLPKGPVDVTWHYEHKVQKKEFAPDVTIRVQCPNLYSNTVKLKFSPPK